MAMKEFEMIIPPPPGSKSPGGDSAYDETRDSANLVNSRDPGDPGTTMWCGCLSLPFYKRFFNVDTKDVKDRWLRTMFFCRTPEPFLTIVADNPDAYGPFWNATTLIFLVALTTNINSYIAFGRGHTDGATVWEYDFTKLVTCTSIVYGFTAGIPLLGWLAFSQMEIALPLVNHFCVYGYALSPFLPAVLLCMAPNEIVVWVSLSLATLISIVFLLRTLTPVVLEQNTNWAAGAVAAYASAQITLMLLLKFLFYKG